MTSKITVSLSVPSALIARVDAVAASGEESRSSVVRRALLLFLRQTETVTVPKNETKPN